MTGPAMVLDERLGYDPEEWEECEETEKFMVFAPFTRLLLTAAAIAFVYYFFRLLDQNKNKSKDEKEEEAEPQQRVEKVIEAARELQLPTPKTPVDAEELLREADHYLRQTSQNGSAAVQRGADAIRNNFPTHELPTPTHATQERFDKMLSSVDNHLQQTSDPRFSAANQEKELYYQNVQQKPTVPEHHIPDHFQQQPYQQLPADFDVYDIPGVQKHQQQQQQVQPPVPPPRKSVQQPQSDRRSQQISEKDERAFLEWEAEKARLEADRLSKLLDTEVGGESSTDLSNSAKAYEKFSPGSHISYESRSEEKAAQIGPTTPVAKRNELTGKILNHIEQTAGQQNNPGTSNTNHDTENGFL
ncbi:unnamed protein product [Caenorhabditis auriculariae]|uniref:Uncharacterized protein n=1 Tax=Caenorhabditis auriculariae TaxID=2777116 RepID=A0A8S1HFL1_9PELO|nr:unnamed protein product [Caenorhabditis auriculariae]